MDEKKEKSDLFAIIGIDSEDEKRQAIQGRKTTGEFKEIRKKFKKTGMRWAK